MWDQPFAHRLVLLTAVLALVAAVELWFRGGQARRYREYLFLLGLGLLSATFGAALDQISSSLSPDYFTLFKGSAPGSGFRAGLYLGALVGTVRQVLRIRRRRALLAFQIPCFT